jgi:hypothetical protein
MIPKQENVKVFSNSKNEKAFTINASREAFRILSSGLYSNKPQAIIRELSCNAYDAHVMAGCTDRPFKVHLPDSWEPFLSIEDFGVGLDDDDINNIYTTYFASTKTQSNDVIGGLGLGSKTPFSYTDTFTIRSRKDAVERIYNAYISDAGSPTVSMVSESDTDEPNGVLITVPIRSADFDIFEREAVNVFKYFKVLPEINFGDLDNRVVTELDEAEGLIINSNTYNAGNVTVIMGNVGYNVKVTDTIVPRDKTRAWSFLAKASMTIRFDIGDLSVAASRETISFDDESKEVFINKLESIVDDYYNAFQEKIDSECSDKASALVFVEGKLGEWGWGLLNYEGESLFDIANKNIVEGIIEIIDPEDEHPAAITLLEKKYNYSDSLSKNVLNDKYGSHRITYKGFRTKKMSFIMDDTEHHRGFDTNSRSFIRNRSVQYLVQVPFVLTDEQQELLIGHLGENLIEFVTLSEVKEMFKVVREKQLGPKADRATPVDRAKKNEIRVDYWRNNDPRAVTHFNEYTQRGLLDIDELSTQKVAIVEISRGYFEHAILGVGMREVNVTNLIYFSKVLNLDYIILVRPSQMGRIQEKMPFAKLLDEFEDKDIVNNDVVFLHQCIKQFAALTLKSFVELTKKDNYNSTIDSMVFNDLYRGYQYRNDSVVEMTKSLGGLDIPEISGDPEAIILADKLKTCFASYTDAEIASCHGSVEMNSSSSSSAHLQIYSGYTKALGAKMYDRTKDILAKYPLLEFLDLYESRTKYINHYIKMVNVMPHPVPLELVVDNTEVDDGELFEEEDSLYSDAA